MAKKITKKQARKETAAAVENALEKYLSTTLSADEGKQTGDASPLGTPYRRGSVTLRGKMIPRHSTTGKLISEGRAPIGAMPTLGARYASSLSS